MDFFHKIFQTVELMKCCLSNCLFSEFFYFLLKDLFQKEFFKHLIISRASNIYPFSACFGE